MEGCCCRRSSRNEGEVRISGNDRGSPERLQQEEGGREGPRVRREWSTCLQLCGGTPRLLWCRYPEATQICVAPSAAPSAARAATGERRRDGNVPGSHFCGALTFVTPAHSLVNQVEVRRQNELTDDLN